MLSKVESKQLWSQLVQALATLSIFKKTLLFNNQFQLNKWLENSLPKDQLSIFQLSLKRNPEQLVPMKQMSKFNTNQLRITPWDNQRHTLKSYSSVTPTSNLCCNRKLVSNVTSVTWKTVEWRRSRKKSETSKTKASLSTNTLLLTWMK